MEQCLDQAFFTEALHQIKEDFAQKSGADGKVMVDLLLRNGQHMRLEGEPVCTAAYISFDRKDGAHLSRIVLPYSSIIGVTLVQESDRRVGFTK